MFSFLVAVSRMLYMKTTTISMHACSHLLPKVMGIYICVFSWQVEIHNRFKLTVHLPLASTSKILYTNCMVLSIH